MTVEGSYAACRSCNGRGPGFGRHCNHHVADLAGDMPRELFSGRVLISKCDGGKCGGLRWRGHGRETFAVGYGFRLRCCRQVPYFDLYRPGGSSTARFRIRRGRDDNGGGSWAMQHGGRGVNALEADLSSVFGEDDPK